MLGLIGAATLGIFVGMSLEEDTKAKIVEDLKKTLYKAQTGRDYKDDKRDTKPNYTTYASYYNKDKKDDKTPQEKIVDIANELIDKDRPWEKALRFESSAKAHDFLTRVKDYVATYGMISVFELCQMRGKDYCISWEYDKYGWTEEMIKGEAIVALGFIYLPKPVALR